jgi:DNA polymerase (family 10)
MLAEGADLTELPGIGKDLSNHIRELIETGRLSVLEELGAEVPRSLAALVALDGVGPKKAKRLWEELGVTSVDELEVFLHAGRVAGLVGFGEKSAAKMARSVEDFRKHQGRFLLSEADVLLAPLLEYLRDSDGVERVEVAGSYRRRKETIGDVDLLILGRGAASDVMDRFTSYEGVGRIDAAGETRGRVLLRSGLPVDVRIVPGESFGAALHYFSGSKEHNVAIRTLGVK